MIGALFVLAVAAAIVVVPATPAVAVELTTPYPGLAVEPGQDVSLDLKVRSPEREKVGLSVGEVPKGWQAFLLGGGHRVSAVSASGKSPEVKLQVQVPDKAKPGNYQVVVTGTGASGTDTLTVGFQVVKQAPGAFDLAVEFPQLQGGTSDTYRFDATIQNNTAQPVEFALKAKGPKGWKVTANPSGEEKAATVSVEPSAEATVQVEADPPEEVKAGTYPVVLSATGEGTTLEQKLAVEITGNPKLTLKTADERLNASGSAGDTTTVQFVVSNTGSGTLKGVDLSASPPSGWEATFDPSTIEQLKPGKNVKVTASIKPGGEVIAGDYSISVEAKGENANDSVDLRYAVETSSLWGFVGVLIILAAIGGLLWTFRRFGRR